MIGEDMIGKKRQRTSEPEVWSPRGGETYIHSQLSEPYGAVEREGLDFSDETKQLVAQFREVNRRVERDGSVTDETRALAKKAILATITIVPEEDYR